MFRVKIALLTVLISGAVLVAFGVFFLNIVSRVGISRIDREILTLGESQLHVWHPLHHWQGFDQSLRSIYGQERWQSLIVHISDAQDRVLYKSPHWPPAIKPASFEGFDFKMASDPEPRFHGPGPVERNADGVDRRPGNRHEPPGFAGPRQGPHPPPPRPSPGPVRIKDPLFRTVTAASGTWRTGIMGNQHITIVLGMDMAGYYEDARYYKQAFLIAVPLALLLLACGGWLIAHRALKPVALITRTAQQITARELDQRIPATAADAELSLLVQVINDMLDRLEKSFGQAVRFSADAAHELQTPLTILQGALDDAVQHAVSGSDEQKRYNSLLEEVGRLKNIVHKLLLLARADADQLKPRLSPVNLSELITSAAEDAGIIGSHLEIDKQIQSGVMVQADPDLIKMVIQGLTTNAVKFNRDEGMIRFGLTVQNNHAVATVANTGNLVPEQERERVFDRFYRLDKSRSGHVPGTGLGLSLAREIVRAHEGELRLAASNENMNTFILRIPCSK